MLRVHLNNYICFGHHSLSVKHHIRGNCCCCSVAKLCPTFCSPMDCTVPGLHVHHQLLELAHTHVHWVGDAIQPSHPLLSPSPPALNLSQHWGLFQWVSSLHQGAKNWSFSIIPYNEYSGLISFRMDWFHHCAVQRTLKSLGTQSSSWSNSHICTWLLEKPQLWLHETLSAKWGLCFFMHRLALSKLPFQGASVL